MPTKEGRYAGAWARQRRVVDYASPPGEPVNPAHMRPDASPPGSRPPYVSPRTSGTPERVIDPGTAYDQVLPHQAPGLVLDTTPQDHGVGLAGGGGYLDSTPGRARRRANRARSVDAGAPARQLYRGPAQRGVEERYTTPLVEIAPTSTGSRVGALRGANSLPENNPESYRVGRRVFRWMMRPMRPRRRYHDLRPLRPLQAAAAVSSPAYPEGNRYTSPFSSTVSGRRRTAMTPETRREPRPWDEDVTVDGITDGTADAYGYGRWGL